LRTLRTAKDTQDSFAEEDWAFEADSREVVEINALAESERHGLRV